jgi:hypothetical protein
MNTENAPETTWNGSPNRECGEHREGHGRSWCLDCTQWCYSHVPCVRCELGDLRALVEQLEASNDIHRDLVKQQLELLDDGHTEPSGPVHSDAHPHLFEFAVHRGRPFEPWCATCGEPVWDHPYAPELDAPDGPLNGSLGPCDDAL